ncbi:hypothetical protein CFOL_v3_05361, partial [Cephalotus follicularis]
IKVPIGQKGNRPCGKLTPAPAPTYGVVIDVIGANPEETDPLLLWSSTSKNSLVQALFLRFFGNSPSFLSGEVVGILRVPLTDTAIAGIVPVPVASMIAGSACSSNQRIVSPSDLWPSSRVSWKILAAHVAGILTLRPRPSTLV